jgi:hypothetical protein
LVINTCKITVPFSSFWFSTFLVKPNHVYYKVGFVLIPFFLGSEYLLFKLVHNLGPEKRNVKILHEQEAVTRLFTALQALQASSHR